MTGARQKGDQDSVACLGGAAERAAVCVFMCSLRRRRPWMRARPAARGPCKTWCDRPSSVRGASHLRCGATTHDPSLSHTLAAWRWAGASSLVLEESEVDTAKLLTMTFGDNVVEPAGLHFIELAVADGTGKVSRLARTTLKREAAADGVWLVCRCCRVGCSCTCAARTSTATSPWTSATPACWSRTRRT